MGSENTLTSILACGSAASNTDGQAYEWMLTVDCDLKGAVSPDWAIFSRKEGVTPETITSIKAIADGIAGLRITNTKNTC